MLAAHVYSRAGDYRGAESLLVNLLKRKPSNMHVFQQWLTLKWLVNPNFNFVPALTDEISGTVSRERLTALVNWGHWHLGYQSWTAILTQVTDWHNESSPLAEECQVRFMRHFGSNQGHLLLLAFQMVKNPGKDIAIETSEGVNYPLIKAIADKFGYDLQIIDTDSWPVSPVNPACEDSLTVCYSNNERSWQIGPASGLQVHRFCASPPLRSLDLDPPMPKILKDPPLRELVQSEWFAVIHLREQSRPWLASQNRDVSSQIVPIIASVVEDAGGLLVRMGPKGVPPVQHPSVIDLAQFPHNADLDMWLWRHARVWIGNLSGASNTSALFRPPRMLLGVWPWEPLGDSLDRWIPRLMWSKDQRRVLNPTETGASEYSRLMNVQLLGKLGYELVDPPESVVVEDIREMLVTQFDNSRSGLRSELEMQFSQVAFGSLGSPDFPRIGRNSLAWVQKVLAASDLQRDG